MSDATHQPLRQPGLLVYACGIGTACLAAWTVNLMHDHGEYPLGWYANGIIPVGAFLLGLLSGLGYALGSYFLNVKLSRVFLLGMIGTGFLDYVLLLYLSYSHQLEIAHVDPAHVTFWQWFQDSSEGMSFKDGGRLGGTGYFFRALELLGFTFGVFTPCSTLLAFPYCRPCQRYLKKHGARHLNSPLTTKEWKKSPKADREAVLKAAIQLQIDAVNAHLPTLRDGTFAQVDTLLATLGDQKRAAPAVCSVAVAVKKCPECDGHYIDVDMTNLTLNGKPNTSSLVYFNKTAPRTQRAATATQ